MQTQITKNSELEINDNRKNILQNTNTNNQPEEEEEKTNVKSFLKLLLKVLILKVFSPVKPKGYWTKLKLNSKMYKAEF